MLNHIDIIALLLAHSDGVEVSSFVAALKYAFGLPVDFFSGVIVHIIKQLQ